MYHMQYRIYHITNLDLILINGQWDKGKFNSVEYVCTKPLILCLVIV